ncbi:TPA: hypothetical protein DCX16_03550 [bacterium]|nr:hypothetical protein [bacterium]
MIKKIFILFLFVLFFLIGIGIIKFFSSSFFDIKYIVVQEDKRFKEDVILATKEFFKKNYRILTPNIFRLNKKALSRSILSDIRIKDVKIKKIPPNKIIIIVFPRKAWAWIREGFGVDEKGFVFPIETTEGIPFIRGFSGIKQGRRIDVENLVFLWTKMKDFLFFEKVKEFLLKGDKIFFLIDGLWVCVPSEKEDMLKNLIKLDVVLKTDLNNVKMIDLSYDDVLLSSSSSF